MSLLLALFAAAAVPAEDMPVAVLIRPVARGERIAAGDLALEPRAPVIARGALTAEGAAGMEAVRNLNAGSVVRSGDVMRPQLVRRGEPVTIKIVSGALVITASGRALAGGGQGEAVRVVTNVTSRTLDGIVEGSGTVRVATP